jgi:tetratricopeptide (TPR) repeat protein
MDKRQKIAQLLPQAMRHHEANELDRAMALYRQILELDSRDADANHLLGLALHQSGNDEQAIPLFKRALMASPRNPFCHANLAELWRKQGKTENALECYRNVLSINPHDMAIRHLMGEALAKLERNAEAVAEYEKIIASGKATSATYWGMSEVLRQVDRMDDAVAAARKAIELDPNSDGAWHAYGWNLVRTGKVRESLPCFERAIQLNSKKPLLYWRRGWARLLLGDYERGWPDYETRWDDEEIQLKDRRPFPGLIWRGDDVNGKTVFVHMEQGAGDALQFLRYVPMIQERGGRVVLECYKDLAPLIARSIPGLELRTDPSQPPPQYDFHVPLLSLPYAFKTTLATVPAKVPYLHADPVAVEVWRARLAEKPGLKIGLTWSGNPKHKNDRHRSIKLAQLGALKDIAGIQLVSLQKGPGSEQIAQVPELNLLNWTDELKNWDDTAALASALDVIITVDTSVAHLAGALAKPTWMLLPFAPDFRWIIDREDTPWYPTMRLFRQQKFNDWQPPLAKLFDEVKAQAGRSSGSSRDT